MIAKEHGVMSDCEELPQESEVEQETSEVRPLSDEELEDVAGGWDNDADPGDDGG